MGVSFDRSDRIAGFRPSVFKDALKGYSQTQSPGNMIDLKSVFPLRRDGALVYEECLDRGLLDLASAEIPEKGLIVARAKVQARTPLAKARQVLDELLDRAERLNADPDAASEVAQIWLFGSVMRDEATVGDIDLAIVPRRVEAVQGDLDAQIARAKRKIAEFSDAPAYWNYPWDCIDWLFRRSIFGRQRHALLAGAQTGTSDLESLGVPCQLIFDRSRGGRVDDPVLPRHPKSTGRDPSMALPPVMPDFTPAPLRPMDGRWLAGYSQHGGVLVYDLFRGWIEEAEAVFPLSGRHLRVLADGFDGRYYRWIPKNLKARKLDGREAIAIINANGISGTSIVLERSIVVGDKQWTLRASFSGSSMHRSRKYVDLTTLPDMAAAVALILATDAERMVRRALEDDTAVPIVVEISDAGLSDEMKDFFLSLIVDLLTKRTVRIEPDGIRE